MKKLIAAILGICSIAAFGLPLIEHQVKGDGFIIQDPQIRTLKSVYIINNGYVDSKTENVSVTSDIPLRYGKPFWWIMKEGTSNDIASVVSVKIRPYNAWRWFVDGYLVKEADDDPNSYRLEYEGPIYDTVDGEKVEVTNSYLKINYRMYTDTGLYKVRYTYELTNNLSQVVTTTQPVPAHDSGTYNYDDNYPYLVGLNIIDRVFGYWGYKKTAIEGTNTVYIGSKKTYTDSTYTYNIINFSTSDGYAITNGIDVVIPPGTKISVNASDDQDITGLIFE